MSQCLDTQAIWSQMNEALRRYIRRRVSGVFGGDDHATDDLVQETFLRIQRNIHTLRSADRMAAWVYKIARNVIHDHYRANYARPRSRKAELSPDLADDHEPPQDPLCGEGARWLDELIAQLPEQYQQAIRLAEIENLPQREVAARLGLSLSGAKSRIQRGRALLKQALERCCVFHLDARGNVIDIDPKPERTVCRSSCS